MKEKSIRKKLIKTNELKFIRVCSFRRNLSEISIDSINHFRQYGTILYLE